MFSKERRKILVNRLNDSKYGFFSETDETTGKEKCSKCGITDKDKTVDFGYIIINRSWDFREYTLCLNCLEEIRGIIGDDY